MKLLGYDRKSQDRYVDAQKLARDYAYVDATNIERAAGLLRDQIPGLHSAAGSMFRAGEEAAAIGRANAANILAETGEWARRRGGEQGAEQSMNRAMAAASGIRLDTGGSSDIFQQAVKDEHSKEIAWGWKAGRSQADIATRQGKQVQMEANSAAESILAGIPAIQSQAALYETDASQLRTSADLAVAEARANRASARSSAYLSGITTIIAAAATYGTYAGWGAATTTVAGGSAGGVLGTGLSAGQLALGGVAIGGGLLALSGLGSGASPEQLAAYNSRPAPNTKIAGINTGAGLDTSQLPAEASFTMPAPPESARANATSKRQYAAQKTKKTTETNIFGQTGNPLTAVGAFA